MTHEIPIPGGGRSPRRFRPHPEEFRTHEMENRIEVGLQIYSFLDAHYRANALREPEGRRRPEQYQSLLEYFNKYVDVHAKRAEEISTREYAEVVGLAKSQFNYPVFGNDCMDGRNLTAVQHGFTADIFGSFRTAGGTNPEISRDSTTQEITLEKGLYSGMLDRAIVNAPDGVLIQVFDSHIGCAARKGKQVSRMGEPPRDDGLYADIAEKKPRAKAIEKHAETKGGTVHSVFESFDPHTGFLYVGLDTDVARAWAKQYAIEAALEARKTDPQNAAPEYSPHVLERLVANGSIISTEAIAAQHEVKEVLNQYYFDADFENNYIESAKQFWRNIALPQTDGRPALKEVILPLLAAKLVSVYPELAGEEALLHDRAMLLLTNLYSGYLHNTQRAESETGTKYTAKEYRYGVHTEEGFNITEGGYGPYPGLTVFEISSHDPRPAGQAILASTIIRGNRLSANEETRVVDKSGMITDPGEFAAASVPGTLTEIIRDTDTSDYGRILAEIDWTALPKDWYIDKAEQEADVEEFLRNQSENISGEVHHKLVDAVMSLRRRMIVLQDRMDQELMDHDVVVMPTIQDAHRRVLGIPQLLLPGVGLQEAA